MAKAWKVRQGSDPTIGGAWFNLPFVEFVEKLNLQKKDFVQKHGSEYPIGPRFGDQNNLALYAEPSLVVIEVTEEEVANSEWKAGFYLSQLSIHDAEKRLG